MKLDIRYDTPDGGRQWDIHEATILEETAEKIVCRGRCSRNFYYTFEESGNNCRMHMDNNRYSCTMKPCAIPVNQEPDDYEDGVPIILFPAAYVIFEISKIPM